MLQRFKKDYPKFKDLFTFQEFNDVQIQCYTKIFNYNDNMVVSAPTSSGKTVLFELLIAKMMN
jgi:ATP-dependent DNA helicase HFM1/MER3